MLLSDHVCTRPLAIQPLSAHVERILDRFGRKYRHRVAAQESVLAFEAAGSWNDVCDCGPLMTSVSGAFRDDGQGIATDAWREERRSQ